MLPLWVKINICSISIFFLLFPFVIYPHFHLSLMYGQCRVFWVNYCAFCLNSFWFVVLIWKMKPEFSFSLKYQGFDVCWFAKWLELKYKGSVWFVYFGLWFVDYDRIIKNIERGEARISRKDEIMKAIGKKLDRYKNPWLELKIQYGQNKELNMNEKK